MALHHFGMNASKTNALVAFSLIMLATVNHLPLSQKKKHEAPFDLSQLRQPWGLCYDAESRSDIKS